jgi:hypothetical protein
MTTFLARTSIVVTLLLVSAGVSVATAQTKLPVINVTVQYTGKAQVTDKTPIWVFLFNTPNPDGGTPPLVAKRLAKNGGVVQFEYGGTDPAYVFVALDTKGDYDGNSGPPPIGTPIGSYSSDGKTATAVKIMPTTNIKITFNDAVTYQP